MSNKPCLSAAIFFLCESCFVQAPSTEVPFPSATNANSTLKLEDATSVMLQSKSEVSSATAKVGDRVAFRVVKDVKVGDLIAIPRGAEARGLVTAVQQKRRKGQPGNLDIAIESVQVLTGENAPLRAKQHLEGASRNVAKIRDIPVDAIVTFGLSIPIDLFSLSLNGRDAYLSPRTEFMAYLNGDFTLNRIALELLQPIPVQHTGPPTVTIFVPFGSGVRTRVYCGKVLLAKLPGYSYLKVRLPPGKYFFHTNDEQIVEVNLEQCRELYLRVQVSHGKYHLAQVDNADAEDEVAKLHQPGDKHVTKVSDAILPELQAPPKVK